MLINHLASPIHSAAMSILSAFIPDKIYLKPFPSSPMRFLFGTGRLSKNISVVEWFIIVLIGLIVIVFFGTSFRSTMKTDKPSVRLVTFSFGVVLANSNSKSECSALLVHIF